MNICSLLTGLSIFIAAIDMLTVNRGLCSGCKLCVKKCPTGAIKVSGGKARIDNSFCNQCFLCIYACPGSAINQIPEPFRESQPKELTRRINHIKTQVEKLDKKIKIMQNRRRD